MIRRSGCGLSVVRSRIWLLACLIGALSLLTCLPERAASGGKPAGSGDVGGILYHRSKGFLINPPQGFVNDKGAAERLGVPLLYVPEGKNFETARVFIYPKTGTISGEGEDAVSFLVAFTCSKLATRPGGQNLTVKEGRNIPTRTGGKFFVRHFNQGPPPNEWETVAYLSKGGTVLMLVLSARDAEERDKAFPTFEAMVHNVTMLEVNYK